MKTNFEILNYLNLINPELGKMFKKSSKKFLPESFEITDEKIKEQLIFNQFEIEKMPEFLYADKKQNIKYFKNSQKNLKKLIKNAKNFDFSANFKQIFEIYLNLRLKLTNLFLKNFYNQNFLETDAFESLYKINPVMFKCLPDLFEKEIDDCDFSNLEKEYNLTYSELIKMKERKNNKNISKIAQQESVKQVEKIQEKTKNTQKTLEKFEKNASKVKKSYKNDEIEKEKE